jgi:single-strand DNA-binding protein
MGRSVNKVILLGRAGKDPSVHILRTGTIVNLSLATSERYRDIHGDWQEHTEWHNLVGFQRTAEIMRDYVRKGSRLCRAFHNLDYEKDGHMKRRLGFA